jgi:hypothetical protein
VFPLTISSSFDASLLCFLDLIYSLVFLRLTTAEVTQTDFTSFMLYAWQGACTTLITQLRTLEGYQGMIAKMNHTIFQADDIQTPWYLITSEFNWVVALAELFPVRRP